MYKVVITRKSQHQPIAEKYICEDFESTQDRLMMTNVFPKINEKPNIMAFMLDALESFYVEEFEPED